MDPIKPPKTIKIYQLVRQTGMNFSSTSSGTVGLGVGFYSSLQEAEHNRTMEVLKDTTTGMSKPKWHIWELDVPNPASEE
jgi:hypothetical protein